MLLLAPWVRLQASSDVPDDGHQLVLATVTLDASGLVTALEIHSGGPGAGFSFSDRNAASFVDVPGAGERWVWYAQDGTARLWSDADVFSVGKTGPAGAARLQLPSPGNSLEVSAVGGTIGTLTLSADTVMVRGPTARNRCSWTM